MITRLHGKPDWYRLSFDASEPLWGVPGQAFHAKSGGVEAHQTHLPLLDPAQTQAFQPRDSYGSDVWAERERWCAELGFKPRVTQQQAVDFARERTHVLLADEMRLGKTPASLLMHVEWRKLFESRYPKTPYGPLVIVAPLSTRPVWLGWLKRMFPGVSVGVIIGETFDPEVLKQPIVFGHYNVLPQWQAIFNIGTLILDEVHLLANPDAKRTKAVRWLSKRARHIVALTGTPINNFPPNAWAILDILAPGAWGNHYAFCQRYADPQPTAHGTKYEGISNERELKARLSAIMLRRKWRDCQSDLPPITRSVVVAEVSTAERLKLDIIAGKLKAERQHVAANLAAYRRQVSAIKLTTVVQEATRVLERGEPVVIWTWHQEFAERISKRFKDHPAWLVHGGVPAAERERRMAEWRAAPAGVLVASMAVLAAGIDLSHSRIAIFAEIEYVPATIGQAEMRTFSPARAMDVIFVIANHVVDQRIVRALVSKLAAQDPLGVAAATDAIDALRDVVLGAKEEGDLDRLLEALLAGSG